MDCEGQRLAVVESVEGNAALELLDVVYAGDGDVPGASDEMTPDEDRDRLGARDLDPTRS